MSTINLLPWREQLREARKQQFITVWAIAVGVTVLCMAMVHGAFSYKIKGQRAMNQTLKSEIAKLDVQIASIQNIKQERDDLLARMQVIRTLQQSRPSIVKMLDGVVRLVPKGIYMNEMSRQDNQIIIKGLAESNTRVSELMRALTESPLFSLPQLTQIKTDKSGALYESEFELHCLQLTDAGANHG